VTDVSNQKTTGYGLRKNILSPLETLAQSVSAIAPTGSGPPPARLYSFIRNGRETLSMVTF